jgi:hypothetical protein
MLRHGGTTQAFSFASLPHFFACALIVGCGVQVSVGERSGTVGDDNVEDPLTRTAQKYEHALLVSNSTLDKLRARDYHAIYQEVFDAPMKADMDEAGVAAMDQDIAKHFGSMKGYKPLQWSFAPAVEGGQAILYSSKIVEYERGMVRFTFVFKDDGKYEKLVGLHTRERHGVAQPGQL